MSSDQPLTHLPLIIYKALGFKYHKGSYNSNFTYGTMFNVYPFRISCDILPFNCRFGNLAIDLNDSSCTFAKYQYFLRDIFFCLILMYFLLTSSIPCSVLICHGEWVYIVIVLIPQCISHIYFQRT